MYRTSRFVTTILRPSLVLGVLVSLSTTAWAQNPFAIDGTVTDSVNSGVPTQANPPGPQALITDDTNGNAKELGPINGSATKVGVIHNAPLSVLGSVSVNAQVDLDKIYTQTAKDLTNNDLWYYFGWVRDSATGSGFISIEFQQQKAPAACDYSKPDADLITTCNPWKNRSNGDFLILWDQNGSSTTLIKRVFRLVNGQVILPACPQNFPTTQTADCSLITSGLAVFTSDHTGGEAAINLTQDVFPGGGQCVNFANIIPNTVTGNSDTADYKDTVLRDFPDVSNCGTVTVKKVTVPAGRPDTFKYRLLNGGDIFDGVVDADCEDSGTAIDKCEGRVKDGQTDTISNVLAGTNYSLQEYDKPGTFTITSIACTLNNAPTGTFLTDQVTGVTVQVGTTTECTITNTFMLGDPSLSTTPTLKAILYDSVNITLENAIASGTTKTVTFKLFTTADCDATNNTGLVATKTAVATFADGIHGTASTLAALDAVIVTSPGTFYWLVLYPGDTLNNSNSTCGETTAVSWTP